MRVSSKFSIVSHAGTFYPFSNPTQYYQFIKMILWLWRWIADADGFVYYHFNVYFSLWHTFQTDDQIRNFPLPNCYSSLSKIIHTSYWWIIVTMLMFLQFAKNKEVVFSVKSVVQNLVNLLDIMVLWPWLYWRIWDVFVNLRL